MFRHYYKGLPNLPWIIFSFFAFLGLFSLPGCVSSGDDRVSHFNEDGVWLYQKGDYTRARENFDLARQLNPRDASLYYNLGQCCDRQGRPKKAEEYYRLCLNYDPNHAPARNALSELLVLQGQRRQADEIITTWLASEPKLADAYVEHALIYQRDGDLLKAQARLQQALHLDPKNVNALIRLGRLYEVMERPDRALVLYEKALAINGTNPYLRRHIVALKARGIKPPLPDA